MQDRQPRHVVRLLEHPDRLLPFMRLPPPRQILHHLAQRQRGKNKRQHHGASLRGDDDAMAIMPVGNRPAYRRQQKDGNLPRESNRSQQQGRSREPVNQPRLRDHLHPGANQRDELAGKEQLEIAMTQGT